MATVRVEIYDKILAMLDQYTEDGVPVAEADNIDIEKKVIVLTDMNQKEVWKYNKNTKQVEIVNKPDENRLGLLSNFKLVDFEGETQYYPNEAGIDNIQGYSIQVTEGANNNATLTYQELIAGVWTDLIVLTPTTVDTIETFKGVLSVTSTTNPVRLKVEGTEHFRHTNRALWKLKYKPELVPTYEPWVKYDLPDDFNSVDMVIEEFPQRQYSQSANHKIENYRDFYYNFYFEGMIRITYKPVPATITSLDDELQIDTAFAQTIVYDVVSKLGFYENPDLVNWAEGRRIENKQEATNDEPLSAEVIVDFYGG